MDRAVPRVQRARGWGVRRLRACLRLPRPTPRSQAALRETVYPSNNATRTSTCHPLVIKHTVHTQSPPLAAPPPPARRTASLPPSRHTAPTSGSPRPPLAAHTAVSAGVQSMESVGAAGGSEAGGDIRVGASAPPGCFRAWPPPSRRTGAAGRRCAGSVAAGQWPAAAARVSDRRRPLLASAVDQFVLPQSRACRSRTVPTGVPASSGCRVPAGASGRGDTSRRTTGPEGLAPIAVTLGDPKAVGNGGFQQLGGSLEFAAAILPAS